LSLYSRRDDRRQATHQRRHGSFRARKEPLEASIFATTLKRRIETKTRSTFALCALHPIYSIYLRWLIVADACAVGKMTASDADQRATRTRYTTGRSRRLTDLSHLDVLGPAGHPDDLLGDVLAGDCTADRHQCEHLPAVCRSTYAG
jgi:hypothetical protein